MPISARNKLRGKIEEIQLGDVMAHVVVRVGDGKVEPAQIARILAARDRTGAATLAAARGLTLERVMYGRR